ncbi:hypothetical protein [Halostagnicola bangensis]
MRTYHEIVIEKIFYPCHSLADMNRREFIGFAASVGIGTTAGCLFGDSEEYATLQDMYLRNSHSSPVTVELSIESENTDEILYSEEREMSPEGEWHPDCVWPDEPITVVVNHTDGNEQASFTTADEEGCQGLMVEVREQRPALFVHTSSECPIDTARCHTDNER